MRSVLSVQPAKNRNLICFEGKVVIPKALQSRIVDWYHKYLSHPGINRTKETIGQHLWWPKMCDQIAKAVNTCPIWQRNKKQRNKYSHFPPKEAEALHGINYVRI